jgi:putative protease
VYGRPPLFTSRLDSKHFRYQDRFVSPRQEEFTLERYHDLTLARSTLPFSLLAWQEELGRLGVAFQFIDLGAGPVKKEISVVSSLLGGGSHKIRVLKGNYQAVLA